MRTVRSHAFNVALPMARAFTLFTPEGGRSWAEGWDPTHLHPTDGMPERGMVFTTGQGDSRTVWTMIRLVIACDMWCSGTRSPGRQRSVSMTTASAMASCRSAS